MKIENPITKRSVMGFLMGFSHATILVSGYKMIDYDPKLGLLLLLGFIANVVATTILEEEAFSREDARNDQDRY